MTRFTGVLRLRPVQGAMLLLVLALVPFATAAAASTISQAYQTSSSDISEGTLVSLASSGSGSITPATLSNAANLVGVAVNKPVLQLSTGAKDSVQVALGGSTQVLVSDANGTVHAGDKITVSPLAGVGMKAIDSGEIVGTAQKSLSDVNTVAEHVKGTNGQQVTVHVGLLPVTISVSYYSAASTAGSVSAFVPPFLQNVANAVAGKAVSPLRVLIGTIALLLGFFATTLMLYVGVRSGVISIGRNPLAEAALRRGMVDVLISALGVLVVTGVIVAAVVLI
jgi:hypothetical protein